MEKPTMSIKQQLQSFKPYFLLLDEFKSLFDPDIPPETNPQAPSLSELIESGNVSFISKRSPKDLFDA
jgi:hypothetical protein